MTQEEKLLRDCPNIYILERTGATSSSERDMATVHVPLLFELLILVVLLAGTEFVVATDSEVGSSRAAVTGDSSSGSSTQKLGTNSVAFIFRVENFELTSSLSWAIAGKVFTVRTTKTDGSVLTAAENLN